MIVGPSRTFTTREEIKSKTFQKFKENFEACVSSIRKSRISAQSLSQVTSSTAFDPDIMHDGSIKSANIFEQITIEDLKERDGIVNSLHKLILDPAREYSEVSNLLELAGTACDNESLNEVMCGYLLPSHIHWPFFDSLKQEDARAQNLIFERLGGTYPALFNDVLQVVNRDSYNVAIVGAPVRSEY